MSQEKLKEIGDQIEMNHSGEKPKAVPSYTFTNETIDSEGKSQSKDANSSSVEQPNEEEVKVKPNNDEEDSKEIEKVLKDPKFEEEEEEEEERESVKASSSANQSTTSRTNLELDPSSTIFENIKLMDWDEFEDWMIMIQEKGLNHFLRKYLDKKLLDVDKLLINLNLTISMIQEEEEEEDLRGEIKDEEELKKSKSEQQQRLKSFIIIKRSIIKWLKTRKKLKQFNTLEDLVELIKTRSKIMVITGAGISTSCGIPDFRSSDGLYSQLKQEYEDELEDAYQMFDLKFFKSKPHIFYSFAKQIFPFSDSTIKKIKVKKDDEIDKDEFDDKVSSFEEGSKGSFKIDRNFTQNVIDPSDSHRFLKLIEFKSKLLRNYTQNIDTLEMRAGVKNLIQCHGSFASFTCLKCQKNFKSSKDFERLIFESKIILCPICSKKSDDELEKRVQDRTPKKKRRKKNNGYDFDDDDDDDDDDDIDWVSKGLVKPDIIFFGEGLPKAFDEAFESDRSKTDLIIVIGTSLAVSPVSDVLDYIPAEVPQILINRDPINGVNFDIICLGESDLIVRELCKMLGKKDLWDLDEMKKFQRSDLDLIDDEDVGSLSVKKEEDDQKVERKLENDGETKTDNNNNNDYEEDEEVVAVKNLQKQQEEEETQDLPQRVGDSHVWLFKGSNPNHPWLDQWKNDEKNIKEDENSSESEEESD